MATGYHFWPEKGTGGFGNLDAACLLCARQCTASDATEVTICRPTGRKRRRGVMDVRGGKLYCCSDEATKSARLFREKQRNLVEMVPLMLSARRQAGEKASENVSRLVHNLVTLNAQTIQSIYSVAPQGEFSKKDRNTLIRAVARRLEDSEKAAVLVISLLKNANLEKSEFAVYRKLREEEPVGIRRFPVHRVFMLVLSTYWDAFKDKDVFVRVGSCTESVLVDYDTTAASLGLLLDNAVKYVLPGSTIEATFVRADDWVKLSLDMISLRIGGDEVDRLCEEGFSGEEARKIGREGEGRGLYLVEQLLGLSRAELCVERDVDGDCRVYRMGMHFEKNRFMVAMRGG